MDEILVEITRILKNLTTENLSSIPNGCGAYVITVKSGKRYVGSSKTVRTRVQSHQVYNDPNINEPMESVCIYLTKSHMDARILENWLIREIMPELNKSCESKPIGIGFRSKCIQGCEIWDMPRHVRIDVKIKNCIENLVVKNMSSSLLGAPGAYVITTKTDRRYIGSSNSLYNRLRSHMDYKESKNVDEPIKSVCCYLTNDEIDARILEYWLIRELKPELNKEIQPDASRWKTGSKEILFLDNEDKMRKVFEKFSERILSLPGVKEIVRKSWITYQLSPMKNFCAVRITRNCLQIDLKVDKTQLKDPAQISLEIIPTQAWTFNRRLQLSGINEIGEAFELIKQAYECIKH